MEIREPNSQTNYFGPEIQHISHAMVWVKFPKLKQQFGTMRYLIMTMGRCLGYPIGIDKPTAEREYGFYTSILVDLDLSKSIPNQILIEVPGVNDDEIENVATEAATVAQIVNSQERNDVVTPAIQVVQEPTATIPLEPATNLVAEPESTTNLVVPTLATVEIPTAEMVQDTNSGIETLASGPILRVNSPVNESQDSNCSQAVEDSVSPTMCSHTHYIAPHFRSPTVEDTAVTPTNSRVMDSHSASTLRAIDSTSSGDGNRFNVLNEANSLLRTVN
ncbi:hypothetical protein IFM89_034657 [Coptis chinensis]|uniref:DUF4283 domain-containing protein n=1 Tax=Coptis chinensis TaxID=261450 RepID=A0A835LPJ6_9MAGN|nr:hypothetical protein IFM89_034657 [Coptis chinensis]